MQSALHRNWKRVARVVALAGSLALAFAFTPGVTADSGSIRVRFGGDLAETRVVIDLDRAATGRLLSTEAGDQSVVLLLQRVEATTDQSGSGRGLVNSWSLRRELTGVRFQLDLNRTASVRRRFLLPPADGVSGYRYVIDLAAAGGTEARPGTMRAELTPVRSPPQPAAAESTGATPQVRAALDDAAFSALSLIHI